MLIIVVQWYVHCIAAQPPYFAHAHHKVPAVLSSLFLQFAKLRKLQRRTVSGANSTTVSAEPSMADSEAVAAAYGGSSYHRESPHSSLQHAASHHSSVSGGGRPGAGGNKGVKATPRSEHSPSGAVVLPVISEARPQLAELRRRQLQKLHDHQQRKMSNA